jgi:hypothetical protein
MWCIWKKSILILIISCCWRSINAEQAILSEGEVYCVSQGQAELRTDMECNVYIVRAFCRDNLGGNLAGVVLEQGLTTEQMQVIAKELNFSETVFLSKIRPYILHPVLQ